MKTKNIIMVLLVTFILASCAPMTEVVPIEMSVPVTVIPMADDFSFIFQENACSSSNLLDYLDTSSGVLIHTSLDETESLTIPFKLSEKEMETVYQKAISSKFFDYPSKVIARGEVPFATFRLKIINGASTNDVKWTTNFNFEPNFPEDDKLIELYVLVQNIIHSHPEYPAPKSACA